MKPDWTRIGIHAQTPIGQHGSAKVGPRNPDLAAPSRLVARGIEPSLPTASIPDTRKRGGLTAKRAQEIIAQIHSPVSTVSVVVSARIVGRARQFFMAAGDLHDTLKSSDDVPASGAARLQTARSHAAQLFGLLDRKIKKSD
jgi:hypothetical protein